MAKKQKTPPTPSIRFRYRRRRVQILLDRILFLRFLRNLHGRFWGLAGILMMLFGFSICLAIRPDLIKPETAFSDFGSDVRTAPYFAAAVFAGAYGMWRWQRYLARTWKRSAPITGLIWLTVIGLYLIALMPVSWESVPHKIHMFGVVLAGGSMFATAILDGLLTRTRAQHNTNAWRLLRLVSLVLMLSGGWLTFGSADLIGWYHVSLIGESLLLSGYLLWITLKTYAGEGNRTVLSKILHKIVLID